MLLAANPAMPFFNNIDQQALLLNRIRNLSQRRVLIDINQKGKAMEAKSAEELILHRSDHCCAEPENPTHRSSIATKAVAAVACGASAAHTEPKQPG
jgi:hypothetical protein